MCLGGDLHYHLSQHGVFSEKEMRFYAAEIILGLEHMHNRFVVYRDLKVDSLILYFFIVNNSHEKYQMNVSTNTYCVCVSAPSLHPKSIKKGSTSHTVGLGDMFLHYHDL